jgi:hypothetical protein
MNLCRLVTRRAHARLLVAALLAAAVLGCGSERYIVIGTARASSASGYIKVSRHGDSAALTVRLEQLHSVDSLDPSMHAYVVWFESPGVAPKRAGSLHYDPDTRVGELKASSPFRKFVVKVTAEANDKPGVPSSLVVASQDIAAVD